MKYLVLALFAAGVGLIADGHAQSWNSTKNQASDIIYVDQDRTFYCGCLYESHEDNDGSGDITDHAECGFTSPESWRSASEILDWENVVPASLMPVQQFDCWVNGSRGNCERNDAAAQAMLFDLHNLVPSIGQVNRLRLHDRYGELPNDTSDFGACLVEDTTGLFEPPPCAMAMWRGSGCTCEQLTMCISRPMNWRCSKNGLLTTPYRRGRVSEKTGFLG